MSDESRHLAESKPGVPTSISLSPTTSLDLSYLSETERKALLTDYTKGMLDISRKASELNVDVGTLRNTLDTLAGTTKDVAEAGNSVTITHTQSTPIGRTEISMGNTDAARTGKLTKSQTGQRDWTPIYVIAGLVALVFIAIAFNS